MGQRARIFEAKVVGSIARTRRRCEGFRDIVGRLFSFGDNLRLCLGIGRGICSVEDDGW